jgi:hypothetical protein
MDVLVFPLFLHLVSISLASIVELVLRSMSYLLIEEKVVICLRFSVYVHVSSLTILKLLSIVDIEQNRENWQTKCH